MSDLEDMRAIETKALRDALDAGRRERADLYERVVRQDRDATRYREALKGLSWRLDMAAREAETPALYETLCACMNVVREALDP